MIFQIVRCPSCGKTYRSGAYRERIGEPLARCLFCGGEFIDKSINEWELRGVFGRFLYVLFTLLNIWVTGLVSAMLVLLLLILPDLIFKTRWSNVFLKDADNFIALIVICTTFNLARVVIREVGDLRASGARMKNPQYRENLKRAGLLK